MFLDSFTQRVFIIHQFNYQLCSHCSFRLILRKIKQVQEKTRREVLHRNKSSFSHFYIFCCILYVQSIVPLTQYHYITPDGSLAPLFICNMFMGPAGRRTRACRRAFHLSPLLGLFTRVILLKLVQP